MAIGASTYTFQHTESLPPAPSPLLYDCLAAHPIDPSNYHEAKEDKGYDRNQRLVLDVKRLAERRTTEKGKIAKMPLKGSRKAGAGAEKEGGSSGKSTLMSKAPSSSAAASGSRRAADRVREESNRQAIHERRNSAQSLRLDLEGLDLGHGVMSGGRIEMRKEERGGPSKRSAIKKDSPNHARAAFIGHSHALPSTSAAEDTAPRERPEDTFLAHIRDCAESNDDFEKNANPLFELAAHREAHGSSSNNNNNNNNKSNSEEIAGTVTVAPYKDDFDADVSGAEDTEAPSPPDGTQSVWSTLVPILSDPTTTLDILSIEEMGLHSINVGSAEDWEAVTLSHPCEECSGDDHAKAEASPDTQWSVAWSTKRQRKWIVTPSILSASRTVVISDHVTQQQEGDLTLTSSSHATKAFSDDSRFSLRFLQAGTGAPNFTILLANPASHRRQVSKAQAGSGGAVLLSPAGDIRSAAPASVLEEVNQGGAVSKDSDEQWPAMRAMATRRDSRTGMNHHKSSSTISPAAAPMVNLNTRRPSLGKSMSHESILHEAPTGPMQPPPIQTAGIASPPEEKDDASAETPRAVQSHEENERASDDEYREMPRPMQHGMFATSTPFGQYSMGSAATAVEAGMSPFSSASPRSSQQVARDQMSVATPLFTANDGHRGGDFPRQAPSTPTTELDPLSSVPTPRREADAPSHGHKSSSRKDRRLSGWIRKKVLYNSAAASPPPLPPAWQQQGRISPVGPFQMDSRPTLLARPSKANTKADKANIGSAAPEVPAISAVGSSSGSGSDVAAVGGPVMAMGHSQGGESSISTAASSVTSPQSSVSSVPRHGSAIEEMADESSTALSPALTSQSDYVWPGVFSVRGERRRSNSDDNMALMIEAARRRHEVLSGSNPPLTPAITSTGAMAMPGRSHLPLQDKRGANAAFSASLPPQSFSVLDSYNVLARRLAANPLTPTALLDLDNVPANALTMMIPLPMRMKGSSSMSNRGAARYLRVSFVPFTSSQDASAKEGASEAIGHHSASSNWYKKIAHAWNANAGVIRSESQGSSDEDSHHKHDTTRHNHHRACGALEKEASQTSMEAFRIIAKVVGHPVRAPAARDADALPELFAFPVILGVCDRQRSISLIAEGWQAIGLPSGPSDAGPLCGVADLIMAGCVACMDL